MVIESVDRSPARWRALAIRYATALHASGATAAAVEEAATRLLAARGFDAAVMATPTALWVDVDGARVVRLGPAGSHLSRLAALGALARRAEADPGLSAEAFAAELARIEALPGPWPRWLERAAFVVVGGGVAVAMGGGVGDALAATALAGTVAAVDGPARAHPRTAPLADGIAGLVAGAGAPLLAAAGADPARIALAAVTILAPGLALTTAAEETAAGHWTSGTSRLAGALVTLAQLAMGLAVGAALVPPLPARLEAAALPVWAGMAAHLAMAPVVAVLARVGPRDLLPVAAVAAAAALPTHLLGGSTGPMVGAAVATALGARWSARTGAPAGVVQAPALVLLVPGALGLAGMRTAIGGGPGTAWAVATVVAALVVGGFAGRALAGAPR